ncbi:MAG: translation elongation factor Ts [Patescibacteria group bacterium]|jgi:elongation factor Ts
MMDKIKSLRERTGAGMVDCKKALEESGGDMDKAVEILRKKGIAKAAKREERAANEGLILAKIDESGKKAFIIEVNSETDFVSRNGKFISFVENVLKTAQKDQPQNINDLLALKMADGNTVKDNLNSLSGVIAEKLGIKRFDIISTSGTSAAYSHAGGRVAAIAALSAPDQAELAYEIAMQVAAAGPKYITREEVPAEDIEKEKEIYREQLKKEGKPEAMIEKIIQGKLNKYFEEICLVDQEYIKDDGKRVKDILGDVKVEGFVRYSL